MYRFGGALAINAIKFKLFGGISFWYFNFSLAKTGTAD